MRLLSDNPPKTDFHISVIIDAEANGPYKMEFPYTTVATDEYGHLLLISTDTEQFWDLVEYDLNEED